MKRKAEIKLTGIRLNRGSGIGLATQLCGHLRERILCGSFCADFRLPSTRALAQSLGVSRNVTMEAYETLAIEELLVSRVGSGTRVRRGSQGFPPASAPLGLSPRALLRGSNYPLAAVPLQDPDGNCLYVHR